MENTVPAGAALLLDSIMSIEAPEGFDTIYGNNQDKLPKPLTSMTLGDVIDAQKGWSRRFGSSAAGGPQFMRDTLIDLSRELHLSGALLFDAELQTQLGYHLLKRRGYAEFMAGKISRTEFGKRLAMEWASFPVLIKTKGKHRVVSRGETFYAGDKLNKALIPAARVEALLDKVKATGVVKAAPQPIDEPMAEVPTAPVVVPSVIVVPVAEDLGLNVPQIRELQTLLKAKGYIEVGRIDGDVGTDTLSAVTSFQVVEGLPVDGKVTMDLLEKVRAAKMRPVSEGRATATVKDLKDAGIPAVKQASRLKQIGMAIGGLFGVGSVLDGGVPDLDKLAGSIGKTQAILALVGDKLPWLLGLGVAGAAVYFGQRIVSRQLEGFRNGTIR